MKLKVFTYLVMRQDCDMSDIRDISLRVRGTQRLNFHILQMLFLIARALTSASTGSTPFSK